MRRIILPLTITILFSFSCITPKSAAQTDQMKTRWGTYVPNMKRISVDIQIRASELDIIDRDSLILIADQELRKTGIEIVDHRTMLSNPSIGDAIFFFQVPRYGGSGTHAWLLVWCHLPTYDDPDRFYWGYTRSYVLESAPYHNTDTGLREQYRTLVKDTASYYAEAIFKAKSGK